MEVFKAHPTLPKESNPIHLLWNYSSLNTHLPILACHPSHDKLTHVNPVRYKSNICWFWKLLSKTSQMKVVRSGWKKHLPLFVEKDILCIDLSGGLYTEYKSGMPI
jgi:hypothetical protein